VLDVTSGEVRALVGGRDFADSKFDRATQALRQPGSAFKPFVYASALEYYRSPLHKVEDSPLRVTLAGGRVWEPRNYADSYGGTVTLREALIHSRNTATVRLAQEIGLRPAIDLAQSLGISNNLPDLPSTALGAAEVRPIELVAAYAAFANGGARVEPHLIRRVVDRNGQVLWESYPRTQQILDPAVAFVLTTILRDVVDRGTGAAVRAAGFGAPAAGKTGTTNNSTDAWFVGYTPDLAAGIWIGLDDPQPIVRGASGGTLAAPTWGRMMRSIYRSRPTPPDWSPPSGVVVAEVDRATGGAVNPECPVHGPIYSEYFIRNTPSPTPCWRDDYPYALYDSLGVYDSWDEFGVYDSIQDDSLLAEGIDWPELEELRRRAREVREGIGSDQQPDLPDTGSTLDSLRIADEEMDERIDELNRQPEPLPAIPEPVPPTLGQPAANGADSMSAVSPSFEQETRIPGSGEE
jgi:membrane carboxypeptidase/penicillin-binding protein